MNVTKKTVFRMYIAGVHVVAIVSLGLMSWFGYRLHQATRREEQFVERYREVVELMAEQVGVDRPIRTAEDVVAVFDEIILQPQREPAKRRDQN